MRSARAISLHLLLCTCATFGLASHARAEDAQPTTATTSTASAATTTTAAVPADIDKWMTQLGDENWRVREAAQRSLTEAGDGVRPALAELAAKTTVPEVKQRAEEVIRRLDAARAKREAEARRRARGDADLFEASLVTLKFDGAPAREVYDALAAQAGMTLKTLQGEHFWARQNNKNVKIDLDKVPFWEAVDALEQQTDLTFRDWGNEMVLDRAEGAHARGPVFTQGPYKLVAVEMGMPGRYHELKVFVEPKLRILAHAMEADIDEAVDVQGQPVAAQRFGRGRDMHARGGNAFDVRLGLDNTPHRIAHLKGSVRANVVLREAVVEIDDMAKANNAERVIDGRRFMVNLMTPEPGEHLVTLIAYDLPAVAGGGGVTQVKPKLVDDAGNEFTSGGWGGGGNGKRMTYHFTFRAAPACGKPAKLILPFPAETREIKIPFEFGKPPPAK
jgi:hypothetical protein